MLIGTNAKSDAKGISKRIHYGFMEKLGAKNIFKTYGPNEVDPITSPLGYDPHHRFSYLLRYFTPDVVLLYSKFCTESWLPMGFATATVPKICIEVDYWNMSKRVKQWYKKQHFNFIIQRGYYKKSIMKAVWLPFSASEEFKSIADIKMVRRKTPLAFVGRGGNFNVGSHYYPIRRAAIKKLTLNNLIDNRGVVNHNGYPRALGTSRIYLSDTGRVKSPPAKTFEIMAAGGVLFTTPFLGVGNLFPEGKKVCEYYHPDCHDVVEKARALRKKSDGELQEIADNATSAIHSMHMDSHRLEELQEILEVYLNEGRVVKRWGI
jgi:hypothetical protein